MRAPTYGLHVGWSAGTWYHSSLQNQDNYPATPNCRGWTPWTPNMEPMVIHSSKVKRRTEEHASSFITALSKCDEQLPASSGFFAPRRLNEDDACIASQPEQLVVVTQWRNRTLNTQCGCTIKLWESLKSECRKPFNAISDQFHSALLGWSLGGMDLTWIHGWRLTEPHIDKARFQDNKPTWKHPIHM